MRYFQTPVLVFAFVFLFAVAVRPCTAEDEFLDNADNGTSTVLSFNSDPPHEDRNPYEAYWTPQDFQSQYLQSQSEMFQRNRLLPQENDASLPGFRSGKKKGMLQKVFFGAHWTPELGSDGLGIAEASVGVTLALPGPGLGSYGSSYFLLTPKFTYTNVQWDNSHFPDSLFNAGLNITWLKPCNEYWNVMLNVSPGYSSDGEASNDAFRVPITLGATWEPNKYWRIIFGVAYTARSDYSVLPYGGLVYQPNDDWKFELLAPQSRIAKRLYGNTSQQWWNSFVSRRSMHSQMWGYVGLGIGGGAWAVESYRGRSDFAMYREVSLVLGLESIRRDQSSSWTAEIAYLFARKMEFDDGTQPDYRPDDSLCLRVKYSF